MDSRKSFVGFLAIPLRFLLFRSLLGTPSLAAQCVSFNSLRPSHAALQADNYRSRRSDGDVGE
jgi:hypothetical protein